MQVQISNEVESQNKQIPISEKTKQIIAQARAQPRQIRQPPAETFSIGHLLKDDTSPFLPTPPESKQKPNQEKYID